MLFRGGAALTHTCSCYHHHQWLMGGLGWARRSTCRYLVIVLVWGVPAATVLQQLVQYCIDSWKSYVEAHASEDTAPLLDAEPMWRRPLLVMGVSQMKLTLSPSAMSPVVVNPEVDPLAGAGAGTGPSSPVPFKLPLSQADSDAVEGDAVTSRGRGSGVGSGRLAPANGEEVEAPAPGAHEALGARGSRALAEDLVYDVVPGPATHAHQPLPLHDVVALDQVMICSEAQAG